MSDVSRGQGGARRARREEAASGRGLRPGGVIAGIVLIALSIGVAFLVSDQSAKATESTPSAVPVTATDLVCAPASPSAVGADSTTFNVGRAVTGDEPDAAAEGTLQAGPLAAPAPVTLAPGAVAPVTGDPATGVVVRGRDAQARGLFAWRHDEGEIAPCESPRSDWWFSDAGGGLDHASVLILTNPDPGPAVVDLRVLGTTGEADVTVGGTGVTVEPGATVTIELAQIAPGLDDLTVGVDAKRGRVAAFLADRLASGSTRAYDWIPAQEAPATELNIVGLAGNAASRVLWLANPSDDQAVVTVETASANGRVVPVGMTQQTVDPGALLPVDLAGVLPGEAYTLRVLSTEPLVAGVRSIGEKGSSLVHSGVGVPIDTMGGLPVVGNTVVGVTSGADATTAVVRGFDANGGLVGEQELALAAYSTAGWLVPPNSTYVVVVPRSGEVMAAGIYPSATVPMPSLPVSVLVPQVRPAG